MNTAIDETAPTIILVSPENGSIVKPYSWIDIEIEDDVAVSCVIYQWDFNENDTLEEPYDLMAKTSEYPHYLYIYANDTSNNWALAKFVFISDETIPTIDLVTPVNDTLHLSGEPINATVTDLHLNSVMYCWDSEINVTWDAPYTTTLISGDGEHSFRIYANDSAGNWAMKQFLFVTDDLPPIINLISPSNGSLNKAATQVSVGVQDASLDTILYSWDESSSNLTSTVTPLITQIPSGETLHHLFISANDTLGRWTSAEYVFEVDDTSPTINLISPLNGSLVHSGIDVDLVANDSSGNVTLFYRWNGGDDATGVIHIPSGDGVQILDVYVYDIVGNSASARYVFEVDDSAPIINHPHDILIDLNEKFANVTWNPNDSHPLNYTIYQNGTIIESGTWYNGLDIILLINTTQIACYNYTIIVIDSLGNSVSDTIIVQIVNPGSSEIENNHDIIFIIVVSGVIGLIIIIAVLNKRRQSD